MEAQDAKWILVFFKKNMQEQEMNVHHRVLNSCDCLEYVNDIMLVRMPCTDAALLCVLPVGEEYKGR